MPELLLEVGLEEIPARMLASAQAELAERIAGLLARERLIIHEPDSHSYSTPRRLGVRVTGVFQQQPDLIEVLTGPTSSIAFRDGKATPAAYAFAKKAGVEVSQLARTVTSKGEYITAETLRRGQSASVVLQAQLPRELAALTWPKSMYWRPGKPERFARPVRWLLAILDGEIVPVEFAGIVAGNQTYGHRILHGDQAIAINHPSGYIEELEVAYVLPDVEKRRNKIRKALDAATRAVPGLRWREDHPLVDTVTNLTEWPSAVLGRFEDEYLTLPEEVLVTVMRDHQKYFALEDESGELAPYFLAILNTEADERGLAIIRHGNEKVLRARFNDARFFWNFDQRIPLANRMEMLKAVTFEKQLGSYHAKTQANVVVAGALADIAMERGVDLDRPALLEAVELAKTDLTAELVKEFTELQGIVGGLYARAQGHSETVAKAIYWQYSPASAEDAIPPTVEGQILGLADRIRTIVEMFSIGLEPTGSKDPFALRRAANGIVKVLAETALPVSISLLVASGMTGEWPGGGEGARAPEDFQAVIRRVRGFLRERLDFYLRETEGFAYDVISATLSAGDDNIPDVIARAKALAAVRGSEDFAAISAAFKRIKNILRQAAEKQSEPLLAAVNEGLLFEEAEKTLYANATKLAATVEQLRSGQKYSEALEQIATLRPHVDHFFDKVMVMDPEPELRQNRLALIGSVLRGFSKIADFSEIVTG